MRNSTFKTTHLKLASTDADRQLEQIRIIFNKLSPSSLEKDTESILGLSNAYLTNVRQLVVSGEENCIELSLSKLEKTMFDVIGVGKLYNNLYAHIFTELYKSFRDVYGDLLRKRCNLLENSFDSYTHIDPDNDYDGYCVLKKDNEKRRGFVLFLTELHALSPNIFPEKNYIDKHLCLKWVQRIQDLRENEDNMYTIDEIAEVLQLCVERGFGMNTPAFKDLVLDFANSNTEDFDYCGLSVKTMYIFKNMISMHDHECGNTTHSKSK